uniref:Uncharacterized protein n=1 Tax=Globodera rostochiensis TaxID=31243 RepID=A0A914HBR7_GLORO
MEKTIATVKAFLPAMIEQQRGHIVNVASLAWVAGINGLVDYCASKFGTVGFSEALRLELIELGVPITVTTVCTYYINTGMFDGVRELYTRCSLMRMNFFLPWTANVVATFKGFTARAVYAIAGFFGFNRTMETYTGRS